MKGTNKGFKSVVASICCCYLFSVSTYPVKVFADETAFNSNTKSHRKSEILKTYPPNLSEMQEIGFGRNSKVSDNGPLEKKVKPDAHFRDDKGKEYLVFYNNHIEQLSNSIYNEVEFNIHTHKWKFTGDKGFLLKIAAGKVDELGFYEEIRLLPFYIKGAISTSYSNEFLKTFKIAKSSGDLRKSLNICGNILDDEKTQCMAVVARDLSEVAQVQVLEPLADVEKEFYSAMIAKDSHKVKVENLNALLDKYLSRLTPEATLEHSLLFCFPLNRASYYLSNFEKDLQSKDEETLSAMFELRKKINRLTLEHKFIFEQNKAPILGITIDRCKIILEDDQRTMIFLDQQETKKFIQTVEKMLDSKASIISGQYSFEGFTGPQLRELAESLRPESFQDMIDEMEKDIRTAEKECDKMKAASMFSAARAVKQFAVRGDIIQFASNLLPDSGLSTQSGQIQKFNENDVKEYLSFQNSPELSEMESPLALAVNDLNLTPVERSSLIKSFEQFLEYRDMQANLEIKKSKKDYLDEVKKDQDDFLNLFKLYIRLVRGNYSARDDFWGIVVEEIKKCCETVNKRLRTLREYFIQEIQRLD